jgi:hypothetical protein
VNGTTVAIKGLACGAGLMFWAWVYRGHLRKLHAEVGDAPGLWGRVFRIQSALPLAAAVATVALIALA